MCCAATIASISTTGRVSKKATGWPNWPSRLRRPMHAPMGGSPGSTQLEAGSIRTMPHIWTPALEFASEAVKLDPSDGQCWQFLAIIQLYRRDFDQAERCNRQAQALNPNDVRVVATGAEVLAYLGRWEEALDALRQFEALEPLPPNWHWEVLGLTHFALGRYTEACEAMTRMSALNYWNHARLAAFYSHLGNDDKAREHLQAYTAGVPDPSIQVYAQSENYFKNPEDLEPWLEGLRKAGLPE